MSGSGWWSDIMRRARERDTERVLLYDRARRGTIAAWRTSLATLQVPPLLPEYLKMLLGSAIGFWLLAWPVLSIFDVSRLYTYAVLGFVFSLQATYTKYRLAKDPSYQVRKCNCAGTKRDGTEAVLKSGASSLGGVPTSLFGAAVYGALFVLVYTGQLGVAQGVAILGLCVSAYLAWVMVGKVGALCSTCVNIGALNVLLLWQLMQ